MTKRIFNFSKILLSAVLLVAIVLSISACQKNAEAGEKTFTFEVYDLEGKKTFETSITTEATIVGDALIAEGLIEGEDGAYGLYVKKVNGVLADYDIDGTYWAFYENGEMSMNAVGKTNIADGATYSFRISK